MPHRPSKPSAPSSPDGGDLELPADFGDHKLGALPIMVVAGRWVDGPSAPPI